jgi:DNA modification methylase
MTSVPEWKMLRGDCILEMAKLPPACFDMAVFSPPFPAVFSYTSEVGDIGNSENLQGDAGLHMSFFYHQLVRVMKPGRVVIVHVTQIGKRKRDGEEGLYDFRGLNIKLAERAGFVYDYDWLVRRNPQAQAIRTRKWELKFQGLETDRSISRGSLSDYLLKFRAPGDNAVPVNNKGEVSRNDWIAWAEPCWNDVPETETLNVKGTKGEGDTKHIAPLQLEIIRRVVKLYTNPGETVFSPFAGIGSEGYMALKHGRRFFGIELKEEYHRTAVANLKRAVKEHAESSKTLFDGLEEKNGEDDTVAVTDEV